MKASSQILHQSIASNVFLTFTMLRPFLFKSLFCVSSLLKFRNILTIKNIFKLLLLNVHLSLYIFKTCFSLQLSHFASLYQFLCFNVCSLFTSTCLLLLSNFCFYIFSGSQSLGESTIHCEVSSFVASVFPSLLFSPSFLFFLFLLSQNEELHLMFVQARPPPHEQDQFDEASICNFTTRANTMQTE